MITVPDIRWKRCDIKSVGLLAQALAKQQAADAGAAEAFMIEGGYVTEGGSSSVFVIGRDNTFVTRPLSTAILPAITRLAVMRRAQIHGLAVEERAVTIDEALSAAEACYMSASSFVIPVVSIDGRPIGDGQPARSPSGCASFTSKWREGSIDRAVFGGKILLEDSADEIGAAASGFTLPAGQPNPRVRFRFTCA